MAYKMNGETHRRKRRLFAKLLKAADTRGVSSDQLAADLGITVPSLRRLRLGSMAPRLPERSLRDLLDRYEAPRRTSLPGTPERDPASSRTRLKLMLALIPTLDSDDVETLAEALLERI